MNSKELKIKKVLESAGLKYSQIFYIINEFKKQNLLTEAETKKEEKQKPFPFSDIAKFREKITPYKHLGKKQLIQKLQKVENKILQGRLVEALEELIRIEKTLKEKVEKEENKKENENSKELLEFVRFYKEVWINTVGSLPPELEKLPEDKFYAYVMNIAKKFNDLDSVKELYKFWLKLNLEDIPKEIKKNYKYKSILIGKSGRTIKEFYKNYEIIKALREDIENLRKKNDVFNPFLPV